MSSRNTMQARRKNLRRPPSYYKRIRQEHKTKGRTAPTEARNTSKSKASVLKKWNLSVTLHSSHRMSVPDREANILLLDSAPTSMNPPKPSSDTPPQKISRRSSGGPWTNIREYGPVTASITTGGCWRCTSSINVNASWMTGSKETWPM